MNWDDVGKSLLGLAPTLAGALFGPLGSVAGKVLADALGSEATPSAVSEAIRNSPEALAKIKEAEIEWAKTAATIATAAAQQAGSIGDTQRAEIAAGVSWWHWRHMLGYVVGGWVAGIAVATTRLMFIGSAEQITLLSPLLNSVWPYFGAACGLLGYVAMDTSRRTTAAATGQEIPTILGSIIKAVKR